MKKALIITTVGGFLQQFEMNDVLILQKMGYKVYYASNLRVPIYDMQIETLEKMGIVVRHIDIEKSPKRVIKNCRVLFQLKSIIEQEKIDLVHVHNPVGGVIGRLACALSSGVHLKVIYTAHGFHFYKGAPFLNWLLYYPVERITAHFTDCIVTINEEDYRIASEMKLRNGGKVYKIPGVGIDRKRFHRETSIRIQKRKELEIAQNEFLIVSVGELNDNKNHSVVIKAMEKLKSMNIMYMICGKGDKLAELENLIKKTGLEGRVRLMGYRRDIPEILQCADCFVFPSKREGLGIAAIEAISCGLPVIVSDNRGTREYAEDKVNGYVCTGNSPEEYADAITKLYDDDVVRKYMSDNCENTAERFYIENTEKIMEEVYRSMCK